MNYPTAPSGPAFNFQLAEGSTKLVIFFSGAGPRDGTFNFWKLGNKLGAHRLFVNDSRNHWYQSGVPGLGETIDETLSTIRLWVRKLGVKEIYAIGQSMGAYGAILYGARLGARVLAFGAETMLNLEASNSARLLGKNTPMVHPDLRDLIADARRPIFGFAGEREPIDLYCMSKVNGPPNYYPRTIADIGHDMARRLHSRKRLEPFMNRLLANQRPMRTRQDGTALDRPGFADALYDLHRHVTAARYGEAVEAGRSALALHDRADHAFYLTAEALIALRSPEQARPLLECALAIAPDHIDYRFKMADCLAELGDSDRAMAMHQEIIAIQPDFAESFHKLGQLHLARGDYLQALEASSRAAELQPNVSRFAHLRGRVEQRLAKPGSRNTPHLLRRLTRPVAKMSEGLYRSLLKAVARRR